MMSVVHNTRSQGVVQNGSLSESGSMVNGLVMLPGRDDKPGLTRTSTRVNTNSRRQERGPSMFHGKRGGNSSITGSEGSQFSTVHTYEIR